MQDTDQTVIRQVLAANSAGRFTPDAIDLHMRVKDLGIDSLKFILVVLAIEDELGRKVFEVGNLARIETVGDLCRLAADAAQPGSAS